MQKLRHLTEIAGGNEAGVEEQASVGSLRERAYDMLRELLVSGEIRVEETLSEARLAEKLNISRTPVREALVRLIDDGLVESRPNGTRVVADLIAKVPHVIEVRLRLEPFASALAARRMTSDDLDALAAQQDAIEKLLENWDDNKDEILRQNRLFHRTIIEHCGNPTLIDTLARLEPFSVFPRSLTYFSEEDRVQAFKEHREVLDALWRRDSAAAEAISFRHIERAMKALGHGREGGARR